jgi:hypothetical protein
LQNKKKHAPWELNFGQSIWDKTEGTFWELEGNKPGRRGKKQKIHPTPSRKGMTADKKQCILGF